MDVNKKITNGLFSDLYRYREYIIYHSILLLKVRFAGSYLGVIWIVLEPLAFMVVYTLIVKYMFGISQQYYHVSVLVGLVLWKFIQNSIITGVTSISKSKGIIDQINFPKFIIPTVTILENFFRFFISIILSIIIATISGLPLSLHLLELIPVVIVSFLFTYGITLVIAHFGVYIYDLRNILEILLRLLFYLCPIMWVSYPKNEILQFIIKLNPITQLIQSFRDIIITSKSPNYLELIIVSATSLFVIYIGYMLIRKKEKNYGKVIL